MGGKRGPQSLFCRLQPYPLNLEGSRNPLNPEVPLITFSPLYRIATDLGRQGFAFQNHKSAITHAVIIHPSPFHEIIPITVSCFTAVASIELVRSKGGSSERKRCVSQEVTQGVRGARLLLGVRLIGCDLFYSWPLQALTAIRCREV